MNENFQCDNIRNYLYCPNCDRRIILLLEEIDEIDEKRGKK
jgi:hypothetical protein